MLGTLLRHTLRKELQEAHTRGKLSPRPSKLHLKILLYATVVALSMASKNCTNILCFHLRCIMMLHGHTRANTRAKQKHTAQSATLPAECIVKRRV
eukprot:scaffold104835_cov19-Tisochrysis_lutea.AAC.1